MGINVSYSTWIIEKFMLQILLKSLLCFASADKEVLITLVEACVSFEDNSLTIDSTIRILRILFSKEVLQLMRIIFVAFGYRSSQDKVSFFNEDMSWRAILLYNRHLHNFYDCFFIIDFLVPGFCQK